MRDNLKSGGWGSTQFPSCQYDVACSEVGGWQNEANSVVFVRIKAPINGKSEYFSGSGFFLNKKGGYSNDDYPLFFTCGHLLAPLWGGSVYDFSLGDYTMYLYTAYQNAKCNNDPDIKRGIELGCDYTQLDLGSSYNKSLSPYYSSNEDYLIMQVSKPVKKLSNYNVVYSAWSKNFNLQNSNNVGYTVIGHPNGDVKKVFIDNDKANPKSNCFELYFDVGVTEKGLSGAPVFNSTREVVGWYTNYSTSANCNYVGQTISNNLTLCGTLGTINASAFPFYLDPTGTGSASSSNPSPPPASSLPAHCRNCTQDADETGIDCGGSCFPCGMQDVVALKTLKDIASPVKSRYDLIADPDPNTSLALKSGNFSFEAGMNIFLNGGFEVSKGAVFYASIDNELMSEPDRGCGTFCINPANVFTPNGDGINDYWGFGQAFIKEYSIQVFNPEWNNLVYEKMNQPVYSNGTVIAWDGSGWNQTGTYKIGLVYTDCNGVTRSGLYYVYVNYGTKSSSISSDQTVSEIKSIETAEAKIKVYPNPFSNKVSIEYSGNDFPLKYRITDLNGKLITEGKTDNKTEILNLIGFANGAYIINVKAGECNLIQKLIKE
jgi:hypothetical protein